MQNLSGLPETNRVTIPERYRDEMGHMNIQYYIHIFDRAAWGLFTWLGIGIADIEARGGGMFALEQHIRYLAEVHVGETVIVRSRVLGVTAKRLHFMHFMVNETTGKLASTLEVVGSYVDIHQRRTTPFPDDFLKLMNQRVAEHTALHWDAPVCGVMKP